MDPTTTTMATGDEETTQHTIRAEFDSNMVETSLSSTANDWGALEEGADLPFTVQAKPTYRIISVKYKVGEATEEKTANKDNETGKYKIPASDLTNDIVVKITAEKITHTITVTCPEQVTFAITNEGLTLSNENKVTVDEGTVFGFTAKLTDAAKNSHRITKVAYTPAEGAETDLGVRTSGSYSIENIEADISITIEAEAIPTFDVAFSAHDNIEKISEIKLDGVAADPAEITGEAGWKISGIREGTVVSFKVVEKEPYKVKAVKAGNVTLKVRNGVYTYRPTEETKDITIEAELDPAQCYALDLNIVGDADSATVTLTMPDGTTNADGESATLPDLADGAFVTKNAKLHVAVAATTNYALSKKKDAQGADTEESDVTITPAVEGATLEATAGKTNEWDITLVTGKTVTLQVKTEAAALESDKTVTFKVADTAKEDLTLTVAASDKVEKDTSETVGEKYTLKSGLKTLAFTVTTAGAYVPTVTDKANNTIAYQSVSRNAEDNTRTYSYSLNAATLDAAEELTIDKADSKATITFVYDDDQTEVVVKQGSEEVTLTNNVAEIAEGDTVTVETTAKTNCRITKIETKTGEETKTIIAPKGGTDFHKFVLANVDSDTIITITSASASYAKSLKEGTNAVMPDTKGVYSVKDSAAYTAAVTAGADGKVALSKFELKEGSRIVAQTTGEDDEKVVNYTTSFLPGDEDVTITLKDALAGKTLTLNLYDDPEGADAVAKVIATYTLKVEARLDDVDIKINKNKNINQKADTVAYYDIDAKGADVNSIKVEFVEENSGVVDKTATKIENGKLVVVTGINIGETTKLKFSYKDRNGDKQYVKKAKTSNDPLELEVKALPVVNSATKAPGVKLISATDVSLTLSLDAKAAKLPASESMAKGAVYYEIYVETKEGTVPAGIMQGGSFTKYVPADTSEKVLYVGSDASDRGKPALGTGGAWDFNVKVSLIHLNAKDVDEDTTDQNIAKYLVEDEEGNYCQSSEFDTKNKPFSTKAVAYETKLALNKTKAAGAVYTTQQDVVVATPKWSNNASYRKLSSAKDITQGLAQNAGALDVSVVNDEVKVSADTSTALGKHTIEVLAMRDEKTESGFAHNMYAARATVVVNVVRGIEDLSIDVPTTEIYQPENKAANLKAVINYNTKLDADKYGGAKNIAPKAKKVNWYFVSKDVASVDAVDSSTEKSTALANGLIKIDKNGKVSVDKKYQIDAETSSFKILAAAADFADNDAKALSGTITITRKGIDLNAAAIVAYDSTNSKYAVKAATGGTTPTLTAGELNDLTLVGLMPGLSVAADNEYAKTAFENYKIANNLTYTSSNKKAVDVSANGVITVKAPAKNVKLTVATADGTKIKKDVIVTVRYDDNSGTLGLAVERVVKEGDNTPEKTWSAAELAANENAISFNDSAAAYFNLAVKQKETTDGVDSWNDIPDFTNYKITVSGGKNLGIKNGVTNIVVDKKVATVKLEYTHYNAENKKDVKEIKTYTLTNTGYNVQGLAKAPKISFRDKRNSIKAVVVQNDESRYIGFNLQTNGRNYPLDFVNGKQINEDGSFGKDLYVRVDVDGTAITAKNEKAIKALQDSIAQKGYEKLNENGRYGGYVAIDFDDTALTPGSYKLKVGVGTIDDSRNFVLAAEPANITIKVVADKKLSFKPTAAYKISAKSGTVVLTGKASDSSVNYSFKNLQNANVNDKKLGEINEFTKYFTLDESNNTLKMTDLCYSTYFDADGKLKKNFGKKDLFGYVDYEAGYAYTADKDKIKGTTKITVTLQDNAIIKYAISNASASQAKDSVANVTVTANKQPVKIAYAAVDTEDNGTWQTVKKDESVWKANAAVDGSTITLQHTDALTVASAKVTVKVIPDDSLHKAKVEAILSAQTGTDADKLANANAYIKKNGVELKTTITLKDMDNAATKKRIAVDAKNTTLKFTGDWSKQGNLTSEITRAESGYDPEHDNYWIDVPVTELFDGAGESIKDITVTNEAHAAIFGFDYNAGVKRWKDNGTKVDGTIPAISIALNKSALQDADAQRLLYGVKNNATDWSKPKQISVTVNVNYKKAANADETAASDTFTFKLTAPANPNFAAEGKTDFATAIAKLNETSPWDESLTYKGEIEEQVGVNTDRNLAWIWRETETDWWKDNADLTWVNGLDNISDESEAIKKIFETEAKGHLIDITKWYLGSDCGIDIDNAVLTIVEDNGGFTLPTAEADGKIAIKATFTNGVKESSGNTNDNADSNVNAAADGDNEEGDNPTTPTEPTGKQKESEEVTFTITLAKFAARGEDVETKLGSYNPTVTASTTENDIYDDVMTQLSAMDLKNIRIQVNMEKGDSSANITIDIYDLMGEMKTVVKSNVAITNASS